MVKDWGSGLEADRFIGGIDTTNIMKDGTENVLHYLATGLEWIEIYFANSDISASLNFYDLG